MSLENARQFAELVIRNEEIGKQAVAAGAGKTRPEAAQAVSDLAASIGYEFTLEEGCTVSREALAGSRQLESGELTEADLDSVAGGLVTSYNGVTTTYTSAGVAQAVSSSVGGPAGAALGSIAGGIVNGIMNGNPNYSTATNAALGAGQGYNDFKDNVTNFFNSVFGGL